MPVFTLDTSISATSSRVFCIQRIQVRLRISSERQTCLLMTSRSCLMSSGKRCLSVTKCAMPNSMPSLHLATPRVWTTAGTSRRLFSPSRNIYLKTREDRSSRKEKDYSFRSTSMTPALPKKARSAYIFYCLKHRSRIQGQNESISPVEVSRRLGAEWNALTPEEREVGLSTPSHAAI